MKQRVDTVKHVLVLYKLATAGLPDASPHSRDEAGLTFEHAVNNVFTICSASLPLAEATCRSLVSTSGEKCTSMPSKIRKTRRGGNAAQRIGCQAGRHKDGPPIYPMGSVNNIAGLL
jgi:hypothetical protein